MKTHHSLIQGCCLVAALLLSSSMGWAGTLNRSAFKARRQTNLVRQVNSSVLTHSDTLSLRGMGAVYALSIDATIQQPREASFVRIVLEDTKGHDYLVAESDRFRNDTSTVQLSEYCEETAQLAGVSPSFLKCYVAGDATLQITGIHASEQEPMRGESTSEETDAAIKEAQVQSIVERINEYNARHGKLWRAGLTNWALSEYDNDIKEEGDAYTANFKYYTEGFYEMGERHEQRSVNNSPYVSTFDWRNRQGKWWITPIKDQLNSGCCTAFAAVAATEAATQLYYNSILGDEEIDLSEYAVAHYSGVNYYSGINENYLYYPLKYIKEYGAIDEATYPFPSAPLPNMPEICPEGNENIRITDYFKVTTSINNVDSIKKYLIHNGPAVSGIRNFNYNHAMALVGYDTICSDTLFRYIYHWDIDTIFDSTSNMIGKTYWIFKNSYGTNHSFGHNGYAYFVFNDYNYMHNAFFISYPIISRNRTDDDIIVEDADGDGFFNWGIGPRPEDRLPAWAEQEEDGDDSNRLKGSMDEYGFLSDVDYSTSTFVVDHDMTDSELVSSMGGSRFLRCPIRIGTGVTLTIQGDLAFYEGKKIFMNQNSTLKIDGGTLVDPTLYRLGTGSRVMMINGGKIICHKKSDFTLPYGISLEMDEGNIIE